MEFIIGKRYMVGRSEAVYVGEGNYHIVFRTAMNVGDTPVASEFTRDDQVNRLPRENNIDVSKYPYYYLGGVSEPLPIIPIEESAEVTTTNPVTALVAACKELEHYINASGVRDVFPNFEVNVDSDGKVWFEEGAFDTVVEHNIDEITAALDKVRALVEH